jgi:hypothetical protein
MLLKGGMITPVPLDKTKEPMSGLEPLTCASRNYFL